MVKKEILEEPAKIEDMMQETKSNKEESIEDMPLETLTDYIRYNRKARELNKKLRINRYPMKPCPVELHPKETIVFNRNDQPNNPLPVYLSNDMIDFKMTLVPGKTYDLPRCIVEYLAKKGTPIWKPFTNKDGSQDTRKTGMNPRFAIRTIYKD